MSIRSLVLLTPMLAANALPISAMPYFDAAVAQFTTSGVFVSMLHNTGSDGHSWDSIDQVACTDNPTDPTKTNRNCATQPLQNPIYLSAIQEQHAWGIYRTADNPYGVLLDFQTMAKSSLFRSTDSILDLCAGGHDGGGYGNSCPTYWDKVAKKCTVNATNEGICPWASKYCPYTPHCAHPSQRTSTNGEAFADVQKAIQEEVYDTQGALSAPQGNKNPWDHNEFLATGLNVDAMLGVIYNVGPPPGHPITMPKGVVKESMCAFFEKHAAPRFTISGKTKIPIYGYVYANAGTKKGEVVLTKGKDLLECP